MKTRLRFAAALAVAACVVTACGSDEDGGSTAESTASVDAGTSDDGSTDTSTAEATSVDSTESSDTQSSDTESEETSAIDEPSSTSADEPTLDAAALEELIAAAQAEGSLVVYTSNPDSITQPFADAFTERYGVEVSWQQLSTAALEQRFSAEADANANQADVLMSSNSLFLRDQIAGGRLTALADADLPGGFPPAGYPEEFLLMDGLIPIGGEFVIGIAYNTDLVPAEEVPTSFEDLLDPKWSGQLGTINPTTGGAFVWDFWDFLIQEYGEDFVTAIVAQEPTFAEAPIPGAQAMAAGERAIFFPTFASVIGNLQNEGAPVAINFPDTTSGSANMPGLAAQAPHPNAARLWINFLLSEEGNAIYTALEGVASPYGGEDLPPNFVLARTEEANSEESKAKITELLGL